MKDNVKQQDTFFFKWKITLWIKFTQFLCLTRETYLKHSPTFLVSRVGFFFLLWNTDLFKKSSASAIMKSSAAG